jgi:polyisoprenoid-binding protein YceI
MSRKVLFIIMAVGLLMVSAASGADKYQIDPVHSSIDFAVRHMVLSNVKGNFTDFSGVIVHDTADLAKSSVSVTIAASSINTNNVTRDNHLKSPDFFDVAKFPDITFQSERIEKSDSGYIAIGKLTMHGVIKEIALPFTVMGMVKDPTGVMHVGIEAGMTLNRQDYGISWSKTLDNGGLMVGNDVKIDINIEAIKQ